MDKPIEGFTLIETMVVLILMSIILAMGMPSFMNLIEKMSTESEAKTLIESLRTARLVAIEQRTRVVVCPSADGNTCGNDWDSGFLAFKVNDETNTLDAADEILFSHRFKQSVLVTVPNDNNQRFLYNESGWTPGTADSILICAKEGTNVNGFRIIVNRAGRVRVEDSTVNWRNGAGQAVNC